MRRGPGPIQRLLAMLCMALGLVVSTQAAAITVDKVRHGAHVEHEADAALGHVYYTLGEQVSEHAVEAHGRHDADRHDHDHDQQGAPEPAAHHHHYADTSIALSAPLRAAEPAPGLVQALVPPLDTSRPPETTRSGLERPPKRG